MGACIVMPCRAAAQSEGRPISLGVVVAQVASSEFDTTEVGVGLQFAWHPTPLVGAELEVVVHAADMGDDAFSSGRVETLFGITVGPRMGRWRPFAKLRPGILRFWESPEPLVCIAIFPLPVRCTLASGRTAVALDVGGGLELSPSGRTFLRLDAGRRLVSFPGPIRDSSGKPREKGFFTRDVRVAFGGGMKF